MHVLPPPSERSRMTKEDKGKPPGPQPLRDTRKTVEALKRHPIWLAQQAASSKLREAAGVDAEPETGEQVASPEPTAEPAVPSKPEAEAVPAPEPANEPTPSPAASKVAETEIKSI